VTSRRCAAGAIIRVPDATRYALWTHGISVWVMAAGAGRLPVHPTRSPVMTSSRTPLRTMCLGNDKEGRHLDGGADRRRTHAGDW
jgi:hypothetical protein